LSLLIEMIICDLNSSSSAADGRSFNQYVKQSSTNRVQAARLFGILLGKIEFQKKVELFEYSF